MTATQELIGEFVRGGSELAFRELVTRYFDLVYSTAVRLVDGDTHRAEDVAQIVFTDLARMAGRLAPGTLLGGWLHRHTCFVAKTVMRGERRRQARERQAVEMNALDKQGVSVLAQVAPIVDEAINELGADDRDAILLRFFESRNLRSVGEALGLTENAAQKRVARALHELGMLLQRRGVAVPAVTLASGLAAEAVTAAPTGLALGVAGTALAQAGTAASLGVASAKVAALAKLKIGIAAALAVVTIVGVVHFQQQPRAAATNETPSPDAQLVQPDAQAAMGSTPSEAVGQEAGGAVLAASAPEPSARRVTQPQAGVPGAEFSQPPGATSPPTATPGGAIPATVRLQAKPGSKLRIAGTSNIHDWQVEGSIIGGFLEAGPGIPLEPGVTIQPGPVWAQAEAFVPVRSLKSIEKDGKPYSDKMDEIMYEHLRASKFHRINYRLLKMSFKRATRQDDVIQYEYESQGELAVAGVTNRISMPVFIRPIGLGKLSLSGSIAVRMTSFRVEPPAPALALGLIRTGDQVVIAFNWILETASASGRRTSEATPVRPQPANPADTPTGQQEQLPSGSLHLSNADLTQVLAIYGELARVQLDIDETVKRHPAFISLTNSEPLTRAQVVTLLENALFEQAGVVVTHPDSTRATVRLGR